LISEILPLDRFWRMGEAPPMSAQANAGPSPALIRLADPSAGLRIGKRALSSVLRRAYVKKQG
jgi:hypothetical protein